MYTKLPDPVWRTVLNGCVVLFTMFVATIHTLKSSLSCLDVLV